MNILQQPDDGVGELENPVLEFRLLIPRDHDRFSRSWPDCARGSLLSWRLVSNKAARLATSNRSILAAGDRDDQPSPIVQSSLNFRR
jgi:hypothetical protein